MFVNKDKHSRLLRKFVNYGRKKFYSTCPRLLRKFVNYGRKKFYSKCPRLLRKFVNYGRKKFYSTSPKLLRKFVNYGRKKFYNVGPWTSIASRRRILSPDPLPTLRRVRRRSVLDVWTTWKEKSQFIPCRSKLVCLSHSGNAKSLPLESSTWLTLSLARRY